MFKRIAFFVALVLFCLSQPSKAAITPIAIDIVPPVQFPPWDFTVAGVRASALIGSHKEFYGLDLGVVGNITGQAFGGMAVSGLFNLNHGMVTVFPFQIAGITNVNEGVTHSVGLQLAGILNYGQKANSVIGLQIAPVNLTPYTDVYGFQIGLFNQALHVNGFQIGVFNFAESLHGFQIGLLNFNKLGLFSVCPVLNFGI